MPWTYKQQETQDSYNGNKIGSLFGVLTYLSEHRELDKEQLAEIAHIKTSYHEKRYVTTDQVETIFAMVAGSSDNE